jgi:hypothetical protein
MLPKKGDASTKGFLEWFPPRASRLFSKPTRMNPAKRIN